EIDLRRLSAEASGPISSIIAAADELKAQAQQTAAAEVGQDLDRIATASHTLHTMIADGVSAPPLAPIPDSDTARIAVAPAPNTETGNILVVDDTAANREMLRRRLARAGHRVQVVANGPDALTLLRQQPIDLVLLDVIMPQMSGYEVLQRLTAEEALREIPVVMISALDEMDSVVRCIELGAEDYLPKPFDPVLLRARIGACLEKKRLRDREALHLRQLAEWNQRLEQRVNDPVPLPNAAERTLRMALAMRERVGELIVSWRKMGYELELGVGIAQGYATIGAIGYEGRWDYGAIGTVTNLAARLCGEAKPGQILVSKRVLAATDDLFELESVGELA